MDEAKLRKLEQIEQALHAQTAQRSALQGQLSETKAALQELASATESYRIVGNLMVKAAPEKLTSELTQRQEHLTLRITQLDKHETRLREELTKLQEEILESKKDTRGSHG
jgi:prefoldin beta subunit